MSSVHRPVLPCPPAPGRQARQPNAQPAPEDLIAYGRENLAGFKVPKEVDFIEALPRNPGGKVLKRVLRERGAGPA